VTLSTERPSWRSRLHRVLVRIAVGMFVLVCLTYVCECATEWRRRERLEALVQSIKTLQVGVTSDAEVRALSERYGGRFSPEGTFTEPRTSTYSVGFSSPYIKGADGLHTLPGRRLWIAGVELVIRDRRLVRTVVRFMVMRSDGCVLMSGVDVAGRGPSHPAERASYEVFEPHVTGNPNEGLKVLLSPEATTAERDKAFRLNFSCFTALRECRHPCDVLPEAWRGLRVLHPAVRGDSMDADCRQAGR
jgi:hypothetical protein